MAQANAPRQSACSAESQPLELRARLRIAVMELLRQGMEDVQEQLLQFLKAPDQRGVIHLSMALSESTITYEVWREPSLVPERRARMARVLGLPEEVDDAPLLRALMAEVHQAFVEFQASAPGREAWRRYEAVLQACERANVLPIVPGHDTGPMVAELARVGLAHEQGFTRSLLVDPLLVAVGLTPEEGSAAQVMLAGQSVSQLGTLVEHLRGLNPRLTNRQVRKLLQRASTDGTKAVRKRLGQAEVERVQEFTRQLLRLQVVELLFV